jgi:hypothetical protein
MGLREAGLVGQIAGGVLAVVSVFVPALAPFAVGLLTASSIAVTLDPPKIRKDERRTGGKHFAFDQYQNPVGEAAIPIVYGKHKVAPVFTQAYLTPIDEAGELIGGEGAVPSKDQALTLQCVVGEGPLPKDWINEIRVNDQPLFETITGEKIGTGNNSKTKFVFNRRFIQRTSIKLYLDGVQKTLVDARTRVHPHNVAVANGNKKNFEHIEEDNDTRIDYDSITVKFHQFDVVGGQQQTTSSLIEPDITYKIDAKNERKFVVKFDKKPAKGTNISVAYTYTGTEDGFTLNRKKNGEVKVIIDTAPAAGVVLTYDGIVENFPNVSIESRRGEIDQPPIAGLNQVRNTFSVGDELLQGQAITYQAKQKVDDLTLTLSALQGMIIHRTGRDSGRTNSVSALITVDYRVIGDTHWINLPIASGEGTEFQLKGHTEAVKRWEISLLATLKSAHEKGAVTDKVLEAFGRAKYEVRLVRTDNVKAGAGGNNRDKIWFQFATETQHEILSYPGVAYFVLKAVAAEKLQGSVPQVTGVFKGREVKNLDTGVTEWTQNPAWCIADLLTNTRYGAGVAEADLITQDWIDWAAYCDETVELEDGTTEARCQLDVVIDNARPPLAWVKDLAFTAFAVPVLKGKKWGIYIDRARAVDKTYTYTGATSNTAFESLKTGIETREKSPTEIEIAFNNRDDDEYEHQELLIPPATRSGPRMKQSIAVNGCTRKSQAVRIGTHVLLSTQLQKYVVDFEAMPDGALSEAGDVILVKSEIGGWPSGKKFRVLKVAFTHDLKVRMSCREYSDLLYGKAENDQPKALTVKVNQSPAAKAQAKRNLRNLSRSKPKLSLREKRQVVV